MSKYYLICLLVLALRKFSWQSSTKRGSPFLNTRTRLSKHTSFFFLFFLQTPLLLLSFFLLLLFYSKLLLKIFCFVLLHISCRILLIISTTPNCVPCLKAAWKNVLSRDRIHTSNLHVHEIFEDVGIQTLTWGSLHTKIFLF